MLELHATKTPWKIQVHEAVEIVRPRLEAGERITLLIEDYKQAGLLRNLLPERTGKYLRIALAAEARASSRLRFQQDSEVMEITKVRDAQGRGASETTHAVQRCQTSAR